MLASLVDNSNFNHSLPLSRCRARMHFHRDLLLFKLVPASMALQLANTFH